MCVIAKITRANKCWPKEIPFLAKEEPNQKQRVEDSDEGILWCHRQNLKRHEREEVYHNFVQANRECSQICGKDCTRDYFETMHQGIEWPSHESILVTETVEQRHKMSGLKECCALLSVSYSSRMVQINRIYAKTELVDFLAEVGGTISMWIGISILSVNSLIVIFIEFLFIVDK